MGPKVVEQVDEGVNLSNASVTSDNPSPAAVEKTAYTLDSGQGLASHLKNSLPTAEVLDSGHLKSMWEMACVQLSSDYLWDVFRRGGKLHESGNFIECTPAVLREESDGVNVIDVRKWNLLNVKTAVEQVRGGDAAASDFIMSVPPDWANWVLQQAKEFNEGEKSAPSGGLRNILQRLNDITESITSRVNRVFKRNPAILTLVLAANFVATIAPSFLGGETEKEPVQPLTEPQAKVWEAPKADIAGREQVGALAACQAKMQGATDSAEREFWGNQVQIRAHLIQLAAHEGTTPEAHFAGLVDPSNDAETEEAVNAFRKHQQRIQAAEKEYGSPETENGGFSRAKGGNMV